MPIPINQGMTVHDRCRFARMIAQRVAVNRMRTDGLRTFGLYYAAIARSSTT